MRTDLAIMLGALVLSSLVAAALGSPDLGTALAFGQIGFALALTYVFLRRP
jgi:maltodextrin utilization protein YvdJ